MHIPGSRVDTADHLRPPLGRLRLDPQPVQFDQLSDGQLHLVLVAEHRPVVAVDVPLGEAVEHLTGYDPPGQRLGMDDTRLDTDRVDAPCMGLQRNRSRF